MHKRPLLALALLLITLLLGIAACNREDASPEEPIFVPPANNESPSPNNARDNNASDNNGASGNNAAGNPDPTQVLDDEIEQLLLQFAEIQHQRDVIDCKCQGAEPGAPVPSCELPFAPPTGPNACLRENLRPIVEDIRRMTSCYTQELQAYIECVETDCNSDGLRACRSDARQRIQEGCSPSFAVYKQVVDSCPSPG